MSQAAPMELPTILFLIRFYKQAVPTGLGPVSVCFRIRSIGAELFVDEIIAKRIISPKRGGLFLRFK